ncbi:hypothetical protein IFT75_02110 [Pseudomonas sp. CFBP 8758]|uniref:hypothetical protein n=1 Tax=Pseudomonas sp. CFBP 8758 TaxID=2775286 RepID=UPI001781145C|nr:hypothetical protein [Pseudomonas sp. CFBP 8758]MBD8592196.1 hypothetical protein [Pseudomonas sp. CFBP 8758]
MSVILISIVCIIFWTAVSWLSGNAEPWDAAGYWTTVYPAALVLSAVVGAMFLRLSLIAGAIVMFAQLPVVVVSTGVSPLLAAGVIYVALLSIPAMMISWVSGKLRLFCSG